MNSIDSELNSNAEINYDEYVALPDEKSRLMWVEEQLMEREMGLCKRVIKAEVPEDIYRSMRRIIVETNFEASEMLGIKPAPTTIELPSNNRLAAAHSIFNQDTGEYLGSVIRYNVQVLHDILVSMHSDDPDRSREARELLRLLTAHEIYHVKYAHERDLRKNHAEVSVNETYPDASPEDKWFMNRNELAANIFAFQYARNRETKSFDELRDYVKGWGIAYRTVSSHLAERNIIEEREKANGKNNSSPGS